MSALHFVAASTPSPLWFATRAAGVVVLLLLTLSVILGIGTSQRWEGAQTPRVAVALTHRNISLVALVLLLVHIITAIADPFARMGWKDAVVPFSGTYRTFWVALGTLSMELLVAVGLTSAIRFRIGVRLWKSVHWLAYAAWPLALLHGFGTGTDAAAPWFLGLNAACVTAVMVALLRRLARGSWVTLPLRTGFTGAALILVLGGSLWVVKGPLRPDWPLLAGTPKDILIANRPSPTPAHYPGMAFQDRLIGAMTTQAGETYISLRDVAMPQWTIAITPAGANEMLPTVTIEAGNTVICRTPATVTTDIYAVCGTTRILITVARSGNALTGTLTTSGPLS